MQHQAWASLFNLDKGVWLLMWLRGKESSGQHRRFGFDSRLGKIPLASEQLSPCNTTIEPVLYILGVATTEPVALLAATREKPMLKKKKKEGKKKAHTAKINKFRLAR